MADALLDNIDIDLKKTLTDTAQQELKRVREEYGEKVTTRRKEWRKEQTEELVSPMSLVTG